MEAIRRFQRRHGLTADGVIGPQTFRALNTPLAHSVRQIELTRRLEEALRASRTLP